MNKKLWIFLSLTVLVIVAAFLLLNFRLMNSRTSTNSMVASSRANNPGPTWDFSPTVTGLYVEGNGRLAEVLRAQLREALQNQGRVGQVTAINAPADRLDIPVLYVEILPVNHLWTPVYARADYQVIASYASNGDVSFREGAVTRFYSSGSQPVVQFKASTTIADTSLGVISAPGYLDFLAEKMANTILDQLQSRLKR